MQDSTCLNVQILSELKNSFYKVAEEKSKGPRKMNIGGHRGGVSAHSCPNWTHMSQQHNDIRNLEELLHTCVFL